MIKTEERCRDSIVQSDSSSKRYRAGAPIPRCERIESLPRRHYFGCGGVILACFDPRADGDPWDASPNPDHVYFSVTDLEATLKSARDAGAVILHPIETQPWGERSFYCTDPFGNKLCFVAADTPVYRRAAELGMSDRPTLRSRFALSRRKRISGAEPSRLHRDYIRIFANAEVYRLLDSIKMTASPGGSRLRNARGICRNAKTYRLASVSVPEVLSKLG
jgi:hypothetical protein